MTDKELIGIVKGWIESQVESGAIAVADPDWRGPESPKSRCGVVFSEEACASLVSLMKSCSTEIVSGSEVTPEG